jgi:hypothetical protein
MICQGSGKLSPLPRPALHPQAAEAAAGCTERFHTRDALWPLPPKSCCTK